MSRTISREHIFSPHLHGTMPISVMNGLSTCISQAQLIYMVTVQTKLAKLVKEKIERNKYTLCPFYRTGWGSRCRCQNMEQGGVLVNWRWLDGMQMVLQSCSGRRKATGVDLREMVQVQRRGGLSLLLLLLLQVGGKEHRSGTRRKDDLSVLATY